jgi:hypothetical protein
LAWFAAFLACCGRLGAAIASLLALIALFFHSLGTAMMTYVHVPPHPPPTCSAVLTVRQCRLCSSPQRLSQRWPER